MGNSQERQGNNAILWSLFSDGNLSFKNLLVLLRILCLKIFGVYNKEYQHIMLSPQNKFHSQYSKVTGVWAFSNNVKCVNKASSIIGVYNWKSSKDYTITTQFSIISPWLRLIFINK